jgi:FkbM family methyltransferase
VHGDESFSQAGEDLIVRFFFQFRGIGQITYLDVGANDPIELNNTYYFYKRGYHGVLVEPNVSYCEQLRAVRPKDTTLAAGIGFTAAREADYYIMTSPALNTFSKEEVEHQTKVTKGAVAVKEVIKMPLLNINDVMDRYFQAAPTFLSIDTEGLDLAILKSMDFTRFRPKVICAETLLSSTTQTRPEIPEFMATQGYVARGGSLVNTIFIDSKIL